MSGDADLLINVVDASNLERNLYLTLQLLELGIPCIVALNMLDIAEKQNIRIEIDALSARLGCPVIPLVSTRGRGIEALKLAIDRYKANENVELVHYAQPLLNEADSGKSDAFRHPAETTSLAGPANAGRRYLQPRLRR